jgi:sulfate transport system permease protein
MGYAVTYLSLIVLIPLTALVFKSRPFALKQFWTCITDPRVLAAFRFSFSVSLAAAVVNLFAGLLIAWVLVRYSFWGKRILDAAVDLPFALPTAVAGISLATVYSDHGWIGRILAQHGVKVAYTPLGVFVALLFISLPFVVRTVQPVLEDLDLEVEEAAASLGASRLQTFLRVLVPTVAPAMLAGFALAFSRALGEYGSVIFISSNKPMISEIVPQVIISKLEEYDYTGAAAVAVVMLVASFSVLFILNVMQRISQERS